MRSAAICDKKSKELDLAVSEMVFNENEKIYLTGIITNLYELYDLFHTNFPHGNEINILSIGCGNYPLEFAALKAILKKYSPNSKVNFVGVDIANHHLDTAKQIYAKYPEVNFLCADATNKEGLEKALSQAGLLPPDGFHLVVLRHPEISSKAGKPIFTRIVSETVPYLTHESGRFLVSCFIQLEFETLSPLLVSPYYFKMPKNYIRSNGVMVEQNFGSVPMDGHLTILECDGLAYGKNPHASLLLKLKKLPLDAGKMEGILCHFRAKDYYKAIVQACQKGFLAVVAMILKEKEALKFDIEQLVEGKSILDHANLAPESPVKKHIITLLENNGLKKVSELTVRKTVSPLQ